MRNAFGVALLVMVGVSACDKSTTEASPAAGETVLPRACDPLVVAPEPIQLRTVLAAGRAPDGTIWLLDHNGPRPDVVSDERLFESNGDVLQRIEISGSGSSPDFYIATFAEGQIRIELANGAPTRMGETSSLEQDPKNKSFDISASTELTLVGSDVYGSMRLANISKQSLVFDAKTPDGHRFVAFQPAVDFTYDEIRIFYGTDDRLVQRKLISSAASRSGNQSITFDLDGVETTANIFYGGLALGTPFQPVLTAPSGTTPLSPVEGSPGYDAPSSVQKPAAELTAGLSFLCF